MLIPIVAFTAWLGLCFAIESGILNVASGGMIFISLILMCILVLVTFSFFFLPSEGDNKYGPKPEEITFNPSETSNEKSNDDLNDNKNFNPDFSLADYYINKINYKFDNEDKLDKVDKVDKLDKVDNVDNGDNVDNVDNGDGSYNINNSDDVDNID